MERNSQMKEPKLVYEPIPAFSMRGRPRGTVYMYEKYIPLVEEFLSSDADSARVDSDEHGLLGHVQNAIFHSSDRMRVEACVRGGQVWLRRKS